MKGVTTLHSPRLSRPYAQGRKATTHPGSWVSRERVTGNNGVAMGGTQRAGLD